MANKENNNEKNAELVAKKAEKAAAKAEKAAAAKAEKAAKAAEAKAKKAGKASTDKAKKAEKKESAEKKNGFFAKIGKFFVKIGEKLKGLKSEWKKISWASFKSTSKNFLLVLVIVICFAVALGVVDTLCGFGVTGISELGNLIFNK